VRAVLDTNTLVSGIGWEGPPRRILLSLREGRHQFVTSPDLLDELTKVLQYPKLRAIAAHPALHEILAWIHQPEHVAYPVEHIHVIKTDPADNLVLDAAIAGAADVIVSGDRHLLELGVFRNVQIMTARRFVELHLG
jgi:putative PIN family toxin of toxin-antitoxin system